MNIWIDHNSVMDYDTHKLNLGLFDTWSVLSRLRS